MSPGPRTLPRRTVLSGDAPQVESLRQFRDRVLLRSTQGRCVVRAYYVVGPYLAEILEKFPLLKNPVRRILEYMVERLK